MRGRLLLALLGACADAPTPGPAPDEPDADTDTDTDSDTDTDTDADTDSDTDPPTVDTGPFGPADGEGDLMLRHVQGTDEVSLHGLFHADLPVVDASLCWPELLGPCPVGLPLVGYDVDVAPWRPDPDTALGVGPQITFGGFSAGRRVDGLSGVHYRQTHAGAVWPTGQALDLDFSGGQWPALSAPRVLSTPPPVQLLSPAPDEPFRLLPGAHRGLQWVPAPGDHRLTLEIRSDGEPGSTPLYRVFSLEDDGETTVDVDALGLRPENRTVHLTLARTARAEQDVDGNPLTVGARVELPLVADHPPVQGRDLIGVGSLCTTSPVLTEGSWYGFLDTAADDYDLGSDEGCTRGPTPGRDAPYRVTVQPGERITVRGRRLDGDLSLYLVSSCAELRETCATAADEAGAGEEEVLVWRNDSESAVTRYLLVDSPTPGTDLFTLDLTRDLPTLSPASDSCAGLAELPAASGDLTVDLTGALDHLDPGATACSFAAAGGADVMLPVHVPDGWLLRAEADGPVVLYALSDCVDELSCTSGSSRYHPLEWENTSGADVDLALVVDQREGLTLGPVDLRVDVVQPRPLASCLVPGQPLETGFHVLRDLLTVGSVDLAVPGPSCTFANSAGPEGSVPVRLLPGQTLDAVLHSDGEGVLALLATCGAPASWRACDDQPLADEHLRYTNHTGSPEDLTLWIDTWSPPTSSVNAAVSVSVDVTIR